MQLSETKPAKFVKGRRRYYVDPDVQGALLRQAVLHWCWTSATFALVIFVFRVAPAWLSGNGLAGERLSHYLTPYLIASVALFPMIVVSTIRFSNRFVGPIVRVRRVLKDLAEDQHPPAVRFRDGDYWCDIAGDLNAVVNKLHPAQESNSSESRETSDATGLAAPIETTSFDSSIASRQL